MLRLIAAIGFLVLVCFVTPFATPSVTADETSPAAETSPAVKSSPAAKTSPAAKSSPAAKTSPAGDGQPLKVLLVAGGCCHDYVTQSKLLKEGIEQRIHAEVTVELSTETTTQARFKIYESEDWASGFDVVIHDECSANVTEAPYINRILAAHRDGVPAVNLHCAMHSYRSGNFRLPVKEGAANAGWYEMIGLQSTSHGPRTPLDVVYQNDAHPITQGLEDWTTIDEELYNNVRIFGNTEQLAIGNQMQPPNQRELKQNPNAQPKLATATVAWTNQYGPLKTRIFSTTLGHYNETVGDERYFDLIVRGLLWATGKLSPGS